MNFRNLLLPLLLLPVVARAQLRDTLQEHRVTEKRLPQPPAPGLAGLKIQTIDSAQLLRPALTGMSQTLVEQLPVFARNTGVNGPVTLSIRGASAAQSMVLWEGIPMQNPAMGLTDISLLQSGLFQSIHLVPGGAPALWGSGNVGGVLLLESGKPYFPDTARTEGFVGLGGGSFDLRNAMAGVQRFGRKANWAVRAFGNTADYRFTYFPENGPAKEMDHAAIAQCGLLAQGAQWLKSGWITRQDVWWLHSQRGIPPALFETESRKQQNDAALRMRISAEKESGYSKWKAIAALMDEQLQYEDAAIQLESRLKTTTFFGRGQYEQRFSRGRFFVDMPVQYALAQTNGQQYAQSRIALAAGMETRVWREKLQLAGAVRTEKTDEQIVVLPGTNGSLRVGKNTWARASVQRSYRAPTLSERYYFPGGNTTLKPEKGWNAEAGLRREFRKGSFRAYADAGVFYRNIRDWIIWYGGAIWTPHNIARVQTTGLEGEGELHYHSGNTDFGIRPGISYVRAQTLESLVPNDGSVGRQIPHTPLTTARVGAWASRKKLRLDVHSVYAGYRFITADESAWIPGYWLHNASISYAGAFRKTNLFFELRGNNLLNNQYLSVAGRPGLPRHFTIGVMSRF